MSDATKEQPRSYRLEFGPTVIIIDGPDADRWADWIAKRYQETLIDSDRQLRD